MKTQIPMTKTLFAVALIAALISMAAAQEGRLPQASLDREVDLQVPAVPAVLGNPPPVSPDPPKYCTPCLFYAGDFDSTASDANGLANEMDVIVNTGAAVYAPFEVPKGKKWKVEGLFTDNFLTAGTLDPATSPYDIRENITSGNGGTQITGCFGNAKAVAVPTGLSDFGYSIFAVKVKLPGKKCVLNGGKDGDGTEYWESVVPVCTNAQKCPNGYRGFEANDDGAMLHQYGPAEEANDSFFNSVFFGANWQPSSQQQSSSRFSDGVEGIEK